MAQILTHSFGKSFPPSLSFSGYVFIVMGFIGAFSHIYIAALFIVIGVFIAFTKSGIQIHLEENSYRDYNSLLGLKQGKWKSLKQYSYITFMRNHEESATLSRSNRRAVTGATTYYDICLLNDNHREKLTIKRITKRDKARGEIKILSELLNLPMTKYMPCVNTKPSDKRKHRS